MTAKTAAKADAYRLQRITTPEDLEVKMMHNGGVCVSFDDRTFIAGYYYNPNGLCYYGAIYRFTTADHTCEGTVKLVTVSQETFADNGHALAWCMAQK